MGLIDNLVDWFKRTNYTDMGIGLLSFIFIVLTLIALIIILAQTYALKHAYDVGERTEKECGDEFYERERGDYKVTEAYEGGVKNNLETAFKLLTGIIGFLAILIAIIHIVFVWNVFSNSILNSKNTTSPFPDPSNIPSKFVIGVEYTVHVILLILTLYIASIWLANTFSASSKFSTKGIALSPLNVTVNKSGVDNMYAAQVGYLLTLAIITVMAVYNPIRKLYNKLDDNGTAKIFNIKNPSVIPQNSIENLLIAIIAVLVVATIVIPVISSIILKVRQPISEYISNFNTININTQDKEQEATLIRNIYRSDPSKPFPDLNNFTNINELKSYVTHNVNYSDLQAIPVPEDLRQFIHQSSLRGEAFLKFKKDLAGFYNDMNNTSLEIPATTTENPFPNPPNYAQRPGTPNYNVANNALYNISKHFTSQVRDILLNNSLNSSTDSNKIETKRQVFDILNTQVIQNSAYAYANPFSSATLTKLRNMRENKSIRDTVNSMYSVSSGIIFTIFAVALYFLIHYFYLRNTRNALVIVASIVAALLIVGVGFVGFVTKDTWL